MSTGINTQKKSRYKIALTVSLILMLGGALMASLIQSNFGKIKVEEFNIPTNTGNISALLFIPPNATSESPAPLIVTSHGSYNNKEMQDQNFTEWARRGFVVISMDAYNHGSSSLGVVRQGMIDVVEYAYTLNYIDPEKIGISGHSMGGSIADATLQHYVTQEATGAGVNKIAAVLYVGFDGPYADYEVEGIQTPLYPDADLGIIAGKYDEWFFKSEDVANNPLRFLESDNARAFVNQVGADISGSVPSGQLFWGDHEGDPQLRAIWQPVEIHPKNHFSSASAAAGTTFFYEALGTPTGAAFIAPDYQVWQWKEFFNFVGLVGAFLFLYPCARLLMATPFFAGLRGQQAPKRLPALSTGREKASFWGTYLINLIIPGLLVMPVAFTLIGQESFVPFTVTDWFGEPNTNELAGWTLAVAVSIFAVFLLSTAILGGGIRNNIEYWGTRISLGKLMRSLLLGLVVVAALYVIVFAVHFFFLTDFRIWMIAIKPFGLDKAIYAMAYAPGFMIFYLVNTILVDGGNNRENWPNWVVTLISCIANIASIAVLIAIQYVTLLSQGYLPFNSMRIVNLFPLLVLIPLGTIITRHFFRRTGQPYVGAAIIGGLYAMFTVANTMFVASVL